MEHKNVLYGTQTKLAIENFPISGKTFPRTFIRSIGAIKYAAAKVNKALNLLDEDRANAIMDAAQEVIQGNHDNQFPIDIFQTGSGTSTNMNTNEVIANRANQLLQTQGRSQRIHPNDHVNFGQSSNDVIPTVIRIAACLDIYENLLKALNYLQESLIKKIDEYQDVVKTGRTHLMDAMPIRFGQVFSGYNHQIEMAIERLQTSLIRLYELPQGGTAVGTGVNTHPEFGKQMAHTLSHFLSLPLCEARNHFEAQSTIDAPIEISGQLKTIAVSLMKIANDFRWMNSGPYCGIGEIQLPALQAGSSIMPGKVNPVIEEAVIMVCAQVIANDTAITISGTMGNFELNTMLPLVAYNLLFSINILGNAIRLFAKKSVDNMVINTKHIQQFVNKNPILVTALNSIIGYEKAAKIAKRSYNEKRPIIDIALEETKLDQQTLQKYLDPIQMTKKGLISPDNPTNKTN